MNMDHDEYLDLQEQLQDHFDGRYRKIIDCDEKTKDAGDRIAKVEQKVGDIRVELARVNTRLAILIAILSAVAVPLLSLCVKYLFA